MKKWLVYFFLLVFCFCFTSFRIHPYHVGSVEFNYNKKSQTFEITGRFFTDDLENAVSKNKRGGTQKFIALGDIRKFLIQVPRLDYQNEFIKCGLNCFF